jgi:rod shape-determining protein MreD
MSTPRFLIFGFVALVLQGALSQLGLPVVVLPQLMLLVVIGAAFSGSSVPGVISAFLLGILLDLSSAVLVGPWAGAFVAVYAGLALVSQRLFLESGLVAAFVAFVAAIVAGTFFALLSPHSDLAALEHIVQIFGQAAITAALAPWLVAVVAKPGQRRMATSVRNSSSLSAA